MHYNNNEDKKEIECSWCGGEGKSRGLYAIHHGKFFTKCYLTSVDICDNCLLDFSEKIVNIVEEMKPSS